MVRSPCVDKNGVKRGAWSEEEDNILRSYIEKYGHWNWRQLPKFAGLARCGKSCRLRWMNYLKPGVKRGAYTKEEEELILRLHQTLGNKWSIIASKLPGRTDNEIKNYWHTHLQQLKKQDPKSTQNMRKISGKMLLGNQEKKKASTHKDWNVHPDTSSTDQAPSSSCNSTISSQLCNTAPIPEPCSTFWNEPFVLDTSETLISPSGSCNSTVFGSLSSTTSFAEPFKSSWNQPFLLDSSVSMANEYKNQQETLPTSSGEFWEEPFLTDESKSQNFPTDRGHGTLEGFQTGYPFWLDTFCYETLLPLLSKDEGFNSPFSPCEDDVRDMFKKVFPGYGEM